MSANLRRPCATRLGVAAALLVLAAVLVAWFHLHRPVPRAALLPSTTSEAKRSTPPRKTAKRLPLPGTPRAPSTPRWASNGAADRTDAEKVTDRKTLRNGIEATLYAGKSSYPASSLLDLHLELLSTEGEPISGRTDLAFVAFDTLATEQQPINLHFAERPGEPGVYDALVPAPESWEHVTVLCTLNESGATDTPGQNELLQVQIDHSAPASLVNVSGAKLSPDGAEVTVAVDAKRAGRGALRAELRDGTGQSFGAAFGTSDLHAGLGKIALVFPSLRPNDGASRVFYLADLTLFLDETTADFRQDPVPVSIGN